MYAFPYKADCLKQGHTSILQIRYPGTTDTIKKWKQFKNTGYIDILYAVVQYILPWIKFPIVKKTHNFPYQKLKSKGK